MEFYHTTGHLSMVVKKFNFNSFLENPYKGEGVL